MNIMVQDVNIVSHLYLLFFVFVYRFDDLFILVNRPKSCSPKNPCMNNGKCITTAAGSQCVCQNDTSGILCEKCKFLLNI